MPHNVARRHLRWKWSGRLLRRWRRWRRRCKEHSEREEGLETLGDKLSEMKGNVKWWDVMSSNKRSTIAWHNSISYLCWESGGALCSNDGSTFPFCKRRRSRPGRRSWKKSVRNIRAQPRCLMLRSCPLRSTKFDQAIYAYIWTCWKCPRLL